ncbi:helix-turn-helix transcriptional regulator, partial [Paenibacillus graminis]
MNIITVGQNIRKLRDERNITQQQIADSLGVTFQAVSKWECGTTVPDITLLPEIAAYFSVTIDELFK